MSSVLHFICKSVYAFSEGGGIVMGDFLVGGLVVKVFSTVLTPCRIFCWPLGLGHAFGLV